jgi:hypothetical protein
MSCATLPVLRALYEYSGVAALGGRVFGVQAQYQGSVTSTVYGKAVESDGLISVAARFRFLVPH